MTKNERQRLSEIQKRFKLVSTKRVTDVDFLYYLVLKENRRLGAEKLENKILSDSYFGDLLLVGALGVAVGLLISVFLK